MKNVRIWFTKEKECKYISHLDLNRCMLRAVRRAELPIWYTEGFNPHPFVTFPLPISLGVTGLRECMDIRIIQDDYDISAIPEKMNLYLPEGVRVFSATYPVLDPKYISFAEYKARISVDSLKSSELLALIEDIKAGENLIIEKKTKAGMKPVDVLQYVRDMNFSEDISKGLDFSVILPAGNTKNIALSLIFKAIENRIGKELNYEITKCNMFTEEMKPFE